MRAAELNLSAEREKLARVKIEEQLAPRTLEAEQKAQMVEELKQFSGTEFTVSVADDPDSLFLLLSILNVLRDAGWKLHQPHIPPERRTESGFMRASSLVTGVHVRFPPMLAEKVMAAFAAFRFSHLSPFRMISEEGDLRERFHIEVGEKDDGSTLAFLQSLRKAAPTKTSSETEIKETG